MGAVMLRMLERKKEKGRTFDTFIYRTAIKNLKIYLQDRFGKDYAEKLQYDSPLFVNLYGTRVGKRLEPRYVQEMLKRVAPKTGMAKSSLKDSDMNPLRPHALRASGSSLLKNDDMDKDVVNYMMGHKVDYDGAYMDGKDRETYVRHAERVLEPKTAEIASELEDRLKDAEDERWRLKKQIEALWKVSEEFAINFYMAQKQHLKARGYSDEEIKAIREMRKD